MTNIVIETGRLTADPDLFAGQKNNTSTSLAEARAIADNDPLLDEVRDYLIGVE